MPGPTSTIPAGDLSANVAELQTQFGLTSAAITHAMANGRVSPAERDLVRIRLRGLISLALQLEKALTIASLF